MRPIDRNNNTVTGGTVVVLGSLNLGSTAPTVTVQSSVITGPGTYTLFRTGTGIVFDAVTQSAGADLRGKLNVVLPSGYGIQSLSVDSTGLNVSLVVRVFATA